MNGSRQPFGKLTFQQRQRNAELLCNDENKPPCVECEQPIKDYERSHKIADCQRRGAAVHRIHDTCRKKLREQATEQLIATSSQPPGRRTKHDNEPRPVNMFLGCYKCI